MGCLSAFELIIFAFLKETSVSCRFWRWADEVEPINEAAHEPLHSQQDGHGVMLEFERLIELVQRMEVNKVVVERLVYKMNCMLGLFALLVAVVIWKL